ncbi:hypothetical protein RintRC_7442 [Richelia intracellularis]|nr:hypothetical protein RintRC_7442 [Richelia intracellularis]
MSAKPPQLTPIFKGKHCSMGWNLLVSYDSVFGASARGN